MSGFTLIELLIVIAVLALLAAISTSVLSRAERIGRSTATRATMQKIETGLGLFKTEVGVYPYQNHGSGGTPFPAADNNLYRRLAFDLRSDPAANADLLADLEAAQAAYAPGGSHRTITLKASDVRNGDVAKSVLLRVGQERARLAVLSGNPDYTGINGSASLVVPAPVSLGWCDDYIGSELSLREHATGSQSISDAYRRPIVYICPVLPGMRAVLPATKVSNDGNSWSDGPLDAAYYQFAAAGRSLTTTMLSDIRTTAARNYVLGYELWSAGQDGAIAAQRGDAANLDNISSMPYGKDLSP